MYYICCTNTLTQIYIIFFMKQWNDIKDNITKDLLSRGLSNPKIRLNALENIEKIIERYFPDYIKDPYNRFRIIRKQNFKDKVAKHKQNGKLNSAESSIINEIYYRVESIKKVESKIIKEDVNIQTENKSVGYSDNYSNEPLTKREKVVIVVIIIITVIGIYALYNNTKTKSHTKEFPKKSIDKGILKKDYLTKDKTIKVVSDSVVETKFSKTKQLQYNVISTSSLRNEKYSFNIRITKKGTKAELRAIAYSLKNSLKQDYKRVFIVYYLPETKVGNIGWASASFNPKLIVEINGSTLTEDIETRKRENKFKNLNYIGKWYDSYAGNTIIIYKKNNRFYLNKYGNPILLNVENVNNKKRYYPVENDFGEYYIVNQIGNLDVYDYQGYIESYIKR